MYCRACTVLLSAMMLCTYRMYSSVVYNAGMYCDVPIGWVHAARNLAPTVSVNVSALTLQDVPSVSL